MLRGHSGAKTHALRSSSSTVARLPGKQGQGPAIQKIALTGSFFIFSQKSSCCLAGQWTDRWRRAAVEEAMLCSEISASTIDGRQSGHQGESHARQGRARVPYPSQTGATGADRSAMSYLAVRLAGRWKGSWQSAAQPRRRPTRTWRSCRRFAQSRPPRAALPPPSTRRALYHGVALMHA